ncbi:unnamed protein product [Ostreobium quekettii]|uniref:J domain-containing protein n=1 Tax=Ostreobium quekettii TaxID=121088 RepID=A0A8S1JAK7_9CHLO|nr:unnamed protein product [Ostreobium quekettii]
MDGRPRQPPGAAGPPPGDSSTPPADQPPGDSGAGAQVDFNDLFSLRRPRDARAGFASGLKSIAKGLVGGTASLVAAPVVYSQQEGWKGLGKGLAVGVATAVVLPVTGAVVGTTQMLRGLVNTPEAIYEAAVNGRYWDNVKREWVDEPPMPLVEQAQPAGGGGGRGPPVEGGYYEMLNVPTNATQEEIKRQYYLLARQLHPDKNPDDPQAKERFQKLGEAYQVLADPVLRANYDQNGADSLNVNFMDGSEFFGMLFGCEQFEYLVGELYIAATARISVDVFDKSMERVQYERVEKLVTNLRAILERYVQGDKEGFILAQKEEATRLSKVSFGDTMLYTIGKVYEHQADIYLGDVFQSTFARMKQKGDTIRSYIGAAVSGVKAYKAQKRLEKWDESHQGEEASSPMATPAEGSDGAIPDGPPPETTGEQQESVAPEGQTDPQKAYEEMMARHQMEEDAMPVVLEAMWAANVIDIQNTIRRVCKRLLNDGTSKEQKALSRVRAEGLKELGKIFVEYGSQGTGTGVENTEGAKKTMEDAMMRVVEKRHAQDDAMHKAET